ncbi:MAG TPA: non-ribosomal peptide synthetase [Nonomuraea sp.]|nr:non-ribosomal peptide synthetase [Nonomuraea sp.]
MTGPQTPRSLDSAVEGWARRTPHATAVVHAGTSLSYRALERRANRLARHLARAGVTPGSGVGLMVPRSAEFIVAVLAVVKAGAYYLPLGADLPTGRVAGMLRENQIQVMLTHDAPPDRGKLPVEQVIDLDRDASTINLESAEPLGIPPDPERAVYVMYTSGTTGRPKGVAVAHRGVLRLASDPAYLSTGPDERFLLHSSLLFDASTFELWAALLSGATVVVASPDQPSLTQLADLIERDGVTTAFFTTSLFNQLVRLRVHALGQLRNLLFGGEMPSLELVREAVERCPRTRVIHCYGPTECTVFTHHHLVGTPLEDPLPIGRPLVGTYTRIMGDDLRTVPAGTPGELYVGGECLALGYVDQPEATAAAFVPDPFSQAPGALLYRTGDVVVDRPDGTLVFQGRKDAQIKVRGFRIEPAEVEQELRRHPRIDDAVVVKAVVDATDERLVAYLVGPGHDAPGTAELREFLAGRLPSFMVPSTFTFVDRIPLNSSGKADRAALAALPVRAPAAPTAATLVNGSVTEELAALWTRVLGVDSITQDTDFFLSGGHSLQVFEILETVVRTWGVEITVEDFLAEPTIRALSAKIAEGLPVGIPQDGWRGRS